MDKKKKLKSKVIEWLKENKYWKCLAYENQNKELLKIIKDYF